MRHVDLVKGKSYLEIKESWTQEKYISILDDKKAIELFRFRTTNHRLPAVETGRFYNIDYKDRICHQCFRDIGDEFHYLLVCPVFNKERKRFIKRQNIKHPNMLTYKNIMLSSNAKLLNNLSLFVKHIMEIIRT